LETAFEKANFMTDPSAPPETPNLAETASFLRRFADMMSNGYNATHLHRAADLLEILTTRVLAASDEEKVWRHKYDTVTHHAERLEAECDALRHDIDGHLDVTSSILTERDAVRTALQERELEISGLRATLEARGDELDQLGDALEREREEFATKREACEGELSELRIAADRERGELQVQLKVQGDELAALRIVSGRERDALQEKVASLEAKRAELRSAFDRISDLRNQANEIQSIAAPSVAGAPEPEAEAMSIAARPRERDSAAGETDAVVPKATLRQARAQFEYLARQFAPLGDIASQVMCELGAYNMDLALVAGQPSDHLQVREVARSILAPAGAASSGVAGTI
jgi:chromosome segregation ATPase